MPRMETRSPIALFSMVRKTQISASIAIALSLLLVTIAPFSTALAVHHELAAADHDGHEHSDTDLCQWVQYHTGHSLVGEIPTVCSVLYPIAPRLHPRARFFSITLSDSVSSRAPPAI
jgi:hypothetical protein